MRGLAHKRHEVDVLWAEGRANHFDGELGREILAREDIDIGVAGAIAEMSRDGGRLDQLHQRLSCCLRHVLGEMLNQRRPVCLHADGLDAALCTRSLSPAVISMMRCLPHMLIVPPQR